MDNQLKKKTDTKNVIFSDAWWSYFRTRLVETTFEIRFNINNFLVNLDGYHPFDQFCYHSLNGFVKVKEVNIRIVLDLVNLLIGIIFPFIIILEVI